MTAMRCGVAGWPIGHSLSPLIHRTWLAATGIDGLYDAFPAEEEAAFEALVERGRSGELRGLNVTAPWKTQALAVADEATEVARRAGSANLLLFEKGRVFADSTDGAGLLAALAEQAPELDLTRGPALLLGAGGAARAAAAALLDAGAPEVILYNRTAERAHRVANDLGGRLRVGGPAEEAVLVINALGAPADHDFSTTPGARAALDMTYRPLRTDFLRRAAFAGLETVDGLSMLIGQARPSFERLFGMAAPALDVRALALAGMGEEA